MEGEAALGVFCSQIGNFYGNGQQFMELKSHSVQIQEPQQPVFPIRIPQMFLPAFSNSIRHLLSQSQILNQSMTKQMLLQLANSLKIDISSQLDQVDLLFKTKQKILDIFVDQKEQWVEYIKLPRFGSLTEETKNCLTELMQDIWLKYQEECKNPSYLSKYNKYICSSPNVKEKQNFHCSMFNFIKTGYFCEGFEETSIFRPITNFQMPPQRSEFPFFPAKSSFVPAPDQKFIREKYPVKFQDAAFQSAFSRRPEKRGEIKQEFNLSSGDNKMPENRQKHVFKNKKNQRDLLACACKKQQQKYQKYFCCYKCSKKYHPKCLGISNKAGLQNASNICPRCLIQQTSIFQELIGEPVQVFWTNEKQLYKQKITIKASTRRQLFQKDSKLALRLLKIDNKNYLNFPQHAHYEKKDFIREIKMNKYSFSKNGYEDVKISLECLKPKQKNYQYKKSVIILVALCLIRRKSEEEIMGMQFESVDDTYLDQFLQENQQLRISIVDSNFQLISTPVRGSNCYHSEIFSINEIIQNHLQRNNLDCLICNKKCENLKIDKQIQAEIFKIRETLKDDPNHPTSLLYTKDGFKWESQKQQFKFIFGGDDQMINQQQDLL